MDRSSPTEVISIVHDALRFLGLQPILIPRGKIGELRGGSACIDLKKGGGIDSAVVLSRASNELYPVREREQLHKIDYAVRGTIKGILPGRAIATTKLETRGLVKRRVSALSWVVLLTEQGDLERPYLSAVRHPGPGEVWEGGPHDSLVGSLNGDGDLTEALLKLEELSPFRLTIQTDGWGESIRICGDRWMRIEELGSLYLSPLYLMAADGVGRVIKETRGRFGGLSF
jgi:hypothetical protein